MALDEAIFVELLLGTCFGGHCNTVQFIMIWHTVMQQQRITTDTPYLALTGELLGVYFEDLGENWLCFNGTVLCRDVCKPHHYKFMTETHFLHYCHVVERNHCLLLPWLQGSWGQHEAHLRQTGPRWSPCWPHELCYRGSYHWMNVKVSDFSYLRLFVQKFIQASSSNKNQQKFPNT